MHEAEDPSAFLRRLKSTANNADMKNCPFATSILLKYTESLMENPLRQKIKQYLSEELRKTPNIDSLDIVLPTIDAFVSDDNTTRNVKVGRKNNVSCTREEEDRDNKKDNASWVIKDTSTD